MGALRVEKRAVGLVAMKAAVKVAMKVAWMVDKKVE